MKEALNNNNIIQCVYSKQYWASTHNIKFSKIFAVYTIKILLDSKIRFFQAKNPEKISFKHIKTCQLVP